MVKVGGPSVGQGAPVESRAVDEGEKSVPDSEHGKQAGVVPGEDTFISSSAESLAPNEVRASEGVEGAVDEPPVPRARKRSHAEAFGADYQVLPEDVRASYLQAVATFHDVPLEDLEQMQAAADKVSKGLGILRNATSVADSVDSGMVKAADLLDAIEGTEAFCAACAAPPGMRSFKAVTGIVEIAEGAHKRLRLQKDGDKVQESLSTARKLEIVGTFLNHDDLIRAASREQMVDRFLVTVLDSAKHGEELLVLKGALDTASGVTAIAGLASGNPAALGAATALGITATAIKGVQVTVKEGQVRYYEKKRLKADGDLVRNAFDVWKGFAGVGEDAASKPPGGDVARPPVERATRIGEGVEGTRYQKSMWFKEDMAKLIVQRMVLNPGREVYGRILQLCGEKPDALHAKKIDSMSEKQKAALLTRIEHKLSGREDTVKGIKEEIQLKMKAVFEKLSDAFAEFRNLLHGLTDRLAFKEYKSITAKVSELQMSASRRGWSPEQVTTQLFDAALEEGPDTARALRELIHVKGGSKEWRDSSADERIEMRLDRIGRLLDILEEDERITIEDAAKRVRSSLGG